MQTKSHPGYLNSLKSLRREKAVLRRRLMERERDLQERATKLPVEVIKSTAGRLIPFFYNKRGAAISWMVVKGIWGLVFRNKKANKEHSKQSWFSSIKESLFVTVAKAVYGLFTK